MSWKSQIVCSAIILCAAAFLDTSAANISLPGALEAGTRTSFNSGWRFARFGPQADGSILAEPDGPALPTFDDSLWRKLDLPHDWGIEGPFDINLPGNTGKRPWFGIGWYRKEWVVPAADEGKRVFLDIDGAMSDSTVFVNGEDVGGWPYGYSSFRVDLTDELKFGEKNVVAVRLDNRAESSRWYPGGGIYRNTWLVVTDPVHIAHWGVFVTTPEITKAKASVQVQVTVKNDGPEMAEVCVSTDIWRLGDTPVKVASAQPTDAAIPAGAESARTLTATVEKPALWNLDRPALYCALTSVSLGGKVVDTQRTIFGIRSVVIAPAKGLLLNGRKVTIRGVCNHHDLGALGTAFNLRAAERQLEILKEMGCNSVRTSHNPTAPELLDLCDRMGILVLDEAFDCWEGEKSPNDYARFFKDWHVRDVRAQVRRDRNHPSVYMWSAGNEIPEEGKGEHGRSFVVMQELRNLYHEEDPSRLVTVGSNNAETAVNGWFKGMDVFGLNYKPELYKSFHLKNADKPVFGSETASCISSRGEYFFPVNPGKKDGFYNFQVSSYDLYAPGWATSPDDEFESQEKNASFLIGEYVWSGFDYLGEPTPFNTDPTNLLNFHDAVSRKAAEEELTNLGEITSPARSSYFGIMDLCGFKKDRFYNYQARWRPDLPMAHILPHWNWRGREGEVTPVHVYTSGDEAELFLNGTSLGRKKKRAGQFRLRWDKEVRYRPGTLKVVAYKNGKRWAVDTVSTTGAASKLSMEADRSTILPDGKDLSFLTISVKDAKGRMVPRSKNHVSLSISGPGEIVAVDNGDATSLAPFQATRVKAFNGLALAIVRATEPGTITVSATSDGLAGASCTLEAKPPTSSSDSR